MKWHILWHSAGCSLSSAILNVRVSVKELLLADYDEKIKTSEHFCQFVSQSTHPQSSRYRYGMFSVNNEHMVDSAVPSVRATH